MQARLVGCLIFLLWLEFFRTVHRGFLAAIHPTALASQNIANNCPCKETLGVAAMFSLHAKAQQLTKMLD